MSSSSSSRATTTPQDETIIIGAATNQPYIWEGEYKQTWVRDDDDSNFNEEAASQERDSQDKPAAGQRASDDGAPAEDADVQRLLSRRDQRQRALYVDSTATTTAGSTVTVSKVRRGLNRHLVVVMDLSRNGELTDYRPCRAHVMLTELAEFVEAFFDQNPISQMAVVSTHHGVAEPLTELSGNASKHLAAIKAAPRQAGGDPSLENALRLAHSLLALVPRCGTREVLIGYSSLTTCDPGDIHQLLDTLEQAGMRVSILGLGAEVRICRAIVQRTNGLYHVATNKEHLHELLLAHLPPPIQYSATEIEPALIKMGFPSQSADTASLCSCHREIRAGGFLCPQCKSKYCELPVDCCVCGLSLISSPQLARSYHHLFPIPMFHLHRPATRLPRSAAEKHCHGCSAAFARTQPQFECPICHCLFCFHCDELIHESLHVCPGCESLVADDALDGQPAVAVVKKQS